MWRRVVWYKGTNVSEESATSSVSQTLEGIWNPEDEGSIPPRNVGTKLRIHSRKNTKS